MHSAKDTARKITCPTESGELNVKRDRDIPDGCSERKVVDRNQQVPSIREREHRQRLGMTTPNVQEHKRRSHAVEKHDSLCLVKNTAVSELQFCWTRITRIDNWNL